MLVSAAGVGSSAKVTRYAVDTHGKYSGVITATETIRPASWLGKGQSYSLEFSPGLPACLETRYSFSNCPVNSRLDRAGINLRIKGQNYQVAYLTGNVRGVSSVTLSKGVVDRIVQVGTTIAASSRYQIKLEAISAPQTSASVSSVGLVITDNVTGTFETITVRSGDAPTRISDSLYIQVPDSFYTLGRNSVIDRVIRVGATITTPDRHIIRLESISAPQGPNLTSSILFVLTDATGFRGTLTVLSGAAPRRVNDNLYIQVPNSYYSQSGNSTARVIISTGSNSSARIIASSGNMVLRNGMRLTNSPVYNGWNAVITSSLIGSSPAITGIGLTQRR
ncbi:MAG: hypothetical protein V1722_04785 [Candidatus Micrarchaeota archaeon]